MLKELGGGLPGQEVDFPGRNTIVVFRRIATPPPKKILPLGLGRCDSVEDLDLERFFRTIQWAQYTSNHKSPDK